MYSNQQYQSKPYTYMINVKSLGPLLHSKDVYKSSIADLIWLFSENIHTSQSHPFSWLHRLLSKMSTSARRLQTLGEQVGSNNVDSKIRHLTDIAQHIHDNLSGFQQGDLATYFPRLKIWSRPVWELVMMPRNRQRPSPSQQTLKILIFFSIFLSKMTHSRSCKCKISSFLLITNTLDIKIYIYHLSFRVKYCDAQKIEEIRHN